MCGHAVERIFSGHAPVVTTANVDDEKLYTVLMIDPDAPCPDSPTMAQWLHWLVVNVEGKMLQPGFVPVGGSIGGEVAMEYSDPTPPCGCHRLYLCCELFPLFTTYLYFQIYHYGLRTRPQDWR
jgi:phosphatidylethanolamine-binding protein (PEBP) family uncharacterized protein